MGHVTLSSANSHSKPLEFLLIGNIPSIVHGTYHTQTKPYNIPCQKRLGRGSPKNGVIGPSQYGSHPASKRNLLFSKVHTV